jgi:hypothetical protein
MISVFQARGVNGTHGSFLLTIELLFEEKA